MKPTSEAAFETVIEAVLLANGYSTVDGKGFDRERAIFPTEALAFIQATQAKVWEKLEALHGAQTGNRVLESLCKWLDTHGALATLRHGFKCFGKTLRIAFFRPAHGLNPELEARYQANRLGLTRQLHFSPTRKVAGCGAVGQWHPRRHAGAEEPTIGPDGSQRHSPVPARSRPARADL
jgi:type I restriction enzyme R subunit